MRRKLGLVLIDVFCFVLSAFGAQVLRDNLYFRTDRLYEMLPYAALSLCVAVLVLPAFGLHRRMWRYSNVNDLIRIAGAVITSISLTLVAGFSLFRLAGVARSLPILHGVLALSLMSLCRLAAKYIQTRRDAANFSKLATGPQLGSKADETVLVIGLNNVSKLFLASVAEYAPERIAVAGLLAVTEDHEGRIFQGYKIVGSPENLARVLETLEVEGVIVDRIVVTTRFEDLSGEAKAALLDVEKRTNIIVDFFAERIGMGKDWPEPRKPHHDESPPDSNERTVSAALRNFAGDVDPDRQFWRTKRVIDFCVADRKSVV